MEDKIYLLIKNLKKNKKYKKLDHIKVRAFVIKAEKNISL